MFSVYKDEVSKQVSEAPFVAVDADKTIDASCKSQMVIVLFYKTGMTVTERYCRFREMTNNTATGLANAVKDGLKPLGLIDKLIM